MIFAGASSLHVEVEMISALLKLFVVVPVKVLVVLPAKLFAIAASTIGPLVKLALVPVKVALLPVKVVC